MKYQIATRMLKVKRSFIREILKAAEDPNVISFAGGLPNPKFFPVEGIAAATTRVLAADGARVLQYNRTEGYHPLRAFIAARYARLYGLTISPDEILLTNGSQQALDLLGKVLINPGDKLVIEGPGYLGAIQAFSLFEPDFRAVPLLDDGVDTQALAAAFEQHGPHLFYSVPNFQNPSGLTYSDHTRRRVADLLKRHNVLIIEDNPYGELRFRGEHLPPLWHYAPEHTVMLGSFSKIVSPGLRMGWVCARSDIMEHLITVKQAADLHSNYFSQRVLYQFLMDNDLDAHIETIRAAYKRQRDLMIEMMAEYFPPEVRHTEPDGGMFLWVTLPAGMPAMDLFEQALKHNVAFVPGQPFYIDGGGQNTLRLNYSNADDAAIHAGIRRLGEAMKHMLTRP